MCRGNASTRSMEKDFPLPRLYSLRCITTNQDDCLWVRRLRRTIPKLSNLHGKATTRRARKKKSIIELWTNVTWHGWKKPAIVTRWSFRQHFFRDSINCHTTLWFINGVWSVQGTTFLLTAMCSKIDSWQQQRFPWTYDEHLGKLWVAELYVRRGKPRVR